jgi:pyridoxamine-phosphate oxidase
VLDSAVTSAATERVGARATRGLGFEPVKPLAPVRLLEDWLDQACDANVVEPRAVAFVTVGDQGRPSARTVSLKRVEADALVFTSALWTRKVREIATNPHVALLFHWPTVGRQIHVTGRATIAERDLALALFEERDLPNRLQTVVSRQGQAIDSVQPLRALHAHLMTADSTPECPPDWGALRVRPDAVEFWEESPDRLHDRLMYVRSDDEWHLTRLAP